MASESRTLCTNSAHRKDSNVVGAEDTAVTPDNNGSHQHVVPNNLYCSNIKKMIPLKVFIPNVFPNVTKHSHRIQIRTDPPSQEGKVVSKDITIPVGSWSAVELASYLTTKSEIGLGSVLTWTYSNVDGKQGFVITNTDSFNWYVVELDEGVFDMLGLVTEALVATSTTRYVHVPNNNGTYPANAIPNWPNLGGEPLVHVSIQDIGDGNLVNADDGQLYDIVTTVPLTDIPFGETTSFQAPDIATEDLEYVHEKALNNFKVTLLDQHYRPLDLPHNFHVQMVFKLFHRDIITGAKRGIM